MLTLIEALKTDRLDQFLWEQREAGFAPLREAAYIKASQVDLIGIIQSSVKQVAFKIIVAESDNLINRKCSKQAGALDGGSRDR